MSSSAKAVPESMAAGSVWAESRLPIVIIGAGLSGIGIATKLKQAGIASFVIFERAGEIGGTWRDNTYPGVACDVPSPAYSLSFEPNPEWSRAYSPGKEIQAYLLGIVERRGLRAHLRLNTGIDEARFDEASGKWTLRTSTGEQVVARIVVSGVGGLTEPALPEIPGFDTFKGKIIHTARWDHDYDLTGKRVAVIGTGCSGIQVIPAIADKVAHLTVFQRTAGWIMPKLDRELSAKTRRVFRRHPLVLRAARAAVFGLAEFIFGPRIMLDSKWLSRGPERRGLNHMHAAVTDPALREKLTPKFQFGCKRIMLSDDYYPTLARANVDLVTETIECASAHGLRTSDGCEHRVDAIIAATGFDVGFTHAPFAIYGRDGRTMTEVWSAEGAEAYKGVSVAGFPNWFIIMGPNTGPGHTSVLVYSETQMRYIMQAIERLRGGRVKFFDVKKEVQRRYNDKLQARMKHTVWSSGCASWYLAADGKNRALYPGLATEYVLRSRKFKPSEYETEAV